MLMKQSACTNKNQISRPVAMGYWLRCAVRTLNKLCILQVCDLQTFDEWIKLKVRFTILYLDICAVSRINGNSVRKKQ